MPTTVSRRGLLRLGTAGFFGASLMGGTVGAGAAPRGSTTPSLRGEVAHAAQLHDVPAALLLALGYVNTHLEMPAATGYRRGDPEARGTYGVMALVRNPAQDTLGLAAELTGLPVQDLMADRFANLRGGAALLAHSQGRVRPAHPHGWLPAVAGHGGHGPRVHACAGVGGGADYAAEVSDVLRAGFSRRTRSGEWLTLTPQAGGA